MYYSLSNGSGRDRTYDLFVNSKMHRLLCYRTLRPHFAPRAVLTPFSPTQKGGVRGTAGSLFPITGLEPVSQE